MSFQYGEWSSVLRVDDVETRLTVFWGAQDPATSPISQGGRCCGRGLDILQRLTLPLRVI